VSSRLRRKQILGQPSADHFLLADDPDRGVRPRAEVHEVGFVIDQVRGDLRATEGPHGLGTMMAIQDYEVPIRHQDRPFQKPVPANLFRQLLQERRPNPLVSMESLELDDGESRGWGHARRRLRLGHLRDHANRRG